MGKHSSHGQVCYADICIINVVKRIEIFLSWLVEISLMHVLYVESVT